MLNSNTFYKIISVVIALVLWAYVIEVINPTKTDIINDVPVQLLNQDSLTSKGLALSGEASYTVDVKLKGKRANLAKITSGEIIANADLFGYSIGKNYIPVTVSAPDGITVVQAKPTKIDVVIEELVEATKPIKVGFIGAFMDGVEAGHITTKPSEIRVSGAKSEVNAVAYVKASLNTSKLTTEAGSIQTRAVAVNGAGDIVQNVRLSSSYVEINAQLCEVKDVPLQVETVGAVADIYEITNIDVPASIRIKGSHEAIAGISGLSAAAIDISNVSSNTNIPVEVLLPEGVEFASGYENLSVDIEIKAIATKKFTYTADEIMLEGIDGVGNISISTPEIVVTASGSEVVIAGLQKSDLTPYLTLDAESLISATAKVQVRYGKQLGHITVEPGEVRITLNKTE